MKINYYTKLYFFSRFFKALDTKLFLNLSTAQDRFKKTILELYIREKEEEFFMQHEQEFFTSSVLY